MTHGVSPRLQALMDEFDRNPTDSNYSRVMEYAARVLRPHEMKLLTAIATVARPQH